MTILNLSTSGVPLDEMGIMIVDRMYKLNICVLMKEHFWCPLNGLTVDKAEIHLAFRGKLMFSDTRPARKSKPTVPKSPKPSPKPSEPAPGWPWRPRPPASTPTNWCHPLYQ